MISLRSSSLAVLLILAAAGPVPAQQAPSYARQIRPFLTRYCLECHNGTDTEGGLNLETYRGLLAGGDHGPVLSPGKADASRLVRMVEGKGRPAMPPKKAKQPRPEEVALLHAWVDAGAREDDPGIRLTLPDVKPKAHVDAPVAALAYHPAGKYLAAGGRGVVYLFDVTTGELLWNLGGQHPRVTSLAFRRDGKTLAIASSSTGESHEVRLYDFNPETAPEVASGVVVNRHEDVIHDLGFSPDGKLLASCGYDRVIKLWDVAGAEKKELRVLRDHSDSVYGLAFSPDGKLLASVSADRAVKVWNPATGARLVTLSEATDWLYAVAWSPDGVHLAAAGVDRSIRVWQVSATGGRIVHSVFAHEAPVTRLAYSPDGKVLYSLGEDRTVKAWDAGRMVERTVYPRQPEVALSLAVLPAQTGGTPVPQLTPAPQLALGRYDGALVLLDEADGKARGELLPLKPKPPISEKEPNDSPRTGQAVRLPATLLGTIGRAGDVDYYRFEARAGQQVGVQVATTGTGPKLEPILQLIDPTGQVVAESSNGLLGHVCRMAGPHALGIRDRDYRGNSAMSYRLQVGNLAVVTAVFPLGLQRGTDTDVRLEGVNLGPNPIVRLKAPADAAPGSRLPVSLATPAGTPLGSPSVLVEEFPEVVARSGGTSIPVPGTANGRIETAGATQTWRFQAKKGQRLLLEVNARRLGSPLDSVIEILDAAGQPLPRATLRCLARTYIAFRDHDSASPGIRMETWSELAINDYILVGSELLRIRTLPRNPDDDCQFFSQAGQRLGYLGTTPTFHPMGQPMYKVGIHPPGTAFPPNGLPVVPLSYRNDDGGPGFGTDSRLVFDPPADGEYQVRIGDARGQASLAHAYRLTIRPPRPDFSVNFNPTAPKVGKGAAVSINVTAERLDEFDGEIKLELLGLPPGFSAPATSIPAGENTTSFALHAEPTAVVPPKSPPLKLVARASIEGREVVREAAGGQLTVGDPGDIVTTTEQSEVSVRPGGEVRLTVKIERRNGFKGRVPVEVRGLPHGVQVLDVGLNGILITEQETSRTMVIRAEPWVKATEHPFVVFARREGKNSEHAARSVLLRVTGK
jgi:WD40 repeat protein